MAAVILDAVAVPELSDHLQVEHGPLREPLGLQKSILRAQLDHPLVQLDPDRLHGRHESLARSDVVRPRVDGKPVVLVVHPAGDRIDARDLVDLVAEELDPHGIVLVGWPDLQDVTAQAESAAGQIVGRPLVLHLGQLPKIVLERLALATLEEEEHAVIERRLTDAVDAGDGGNDDDVASFEKRLCCRQPELVDLLVLGHLLLDVEIVLRDVRLGLVVVVVGDEILDLVLREEIFELLVELRRQGLVVAEDEGRPVDRLDRLGDGEGLSRAGDAEEDLMPFAGTGSGDQLLDGSDLIALRREGRDELELIHDDGTLRPRPIIQKTGCRPAAGRRAVAGC